MKSNIKTILKHLAAAVMGLLGFASCGEEIEPLAMYGSPYANFKALGTVKDEAGKPIEGIRVAVQQTFRNSNGSICWYEADTVYTDKKGDYLLENNNVQLPGELTFYFEDIDGAENGGEFKSAEAKPEAIKTGDGDGHWYKGLFEAKADVVLKKK